MADLEQKVRVFTSAGVSGKVFSHYRNALQSGSVPFTASLDPGSNFKFRFDSIGIKGGHIGVGRSTPHLVEITNGDIKRASDEYFIFTTRTSCSLTMQRDGCQSTAGCGDLLIYDNSRPLQMLGGSAAVVNNIALLAPKAAFAAITNVEDRFGHACIPRILVPAALRQCLAFIGRHIGSASFNELTALYDASLALLPLAVGLNKDALIEAEMYRTSATYAAIVDCIETNLSEPELSAGFVANKLKVSDRAIHKHFARRGLTFSVYVRNLRLNKTAFDLRTFCERRLPIAVVAARWGFRDLSTFYRLFRAKFHCTPVEYRARNT